MWNSKNYIIQKKTEKEEQIKIIFKKQGKNKIYKTKALLRDNTYIEFS